MPTRYWPDGDFFTDAGRQIFSAEDSNNSVIVGPTDRKTLSVAVTGHHKSLRVLLTPQQAQELIDAIALARDEVLKAAQN